MGYLEIKQYHELHECFSFSIQLSSIEGKQSEQFILLNVAQDSPFVLLMLRWLLIDNWITSDAMSGESVLRYKWPLRLWHNWILLRIECNSILANEQPCSVSLCAQKSAYLTLSALKQRSSLDEVLMSLFAWSFSTWVCTCSEVWESVANIIRALSQRRASIYFNGWLYLILINKTLIIRWLKDGSSFFYRCERIDSHATG